MARLKLIMKPLVKFIYLPTEEKVLFFQSLYYLLIFRIRLITTSPKVLFLIVSRKSDPVVPFKSYRIPSQRIARIINKASVFVPYSTCLSKALAGYVLFAKNSYKTELHIGVLKNQNRQLEGHAWLSYNGKIIIGNLPDINRFKKFDLESLGNRQ